MLSLFEGMGNPATDVDLGVEPGLRSGVGTRRAIHVDFGGAATSSESNNNMHTLMRSRALQFVPFPGGMLLKGECDMY